MELHEHLLRVRFGFRFIDPVPISLTTNVKQQRWVTDDPDSRIEQPVVNATRKFRNLLNRPLRQKDLLIGRSSVSDREKPALNLTTADALGKQELALLQLLLQAKDDGDLLRGERRIALPIYRLQRPRREPEEVFKRRQEHAMIAIIHHHNRHAIGTDGVGPTFCKLIVAVPEPEWMRHADQLRNSSDPTWPQRPSEPLVE